MHIHKPKPLHGVREFLSEISVIVVGVLITLGLEQVVETWHWNHKVEQAEVRLRADLKDDSSYAAQYDILKKCADAYLDKMQTDLLNHDAADMARLYELGPPFIGVPWKVVAWERQRRSRMSNDNSRPTLRSTIISNGCSGGIHPCPPSVRSWPIGVADTGPAAFLNERTALQRVRLGGASEHRCM